MLRRNLIKLTGLHICALTKFLTMVRQKNQNSWFYEKPFSDWPSKQQMIQGFLCQGHLLSWISGNEDDASNRLLLRRWRWSQWWWCRWWLWRSWWWWCSIYFLQFLTIVSAVSTWDRSSDSIWQQHQVKRFVWSDPSRWTRCDDFSDCVAVCMSVRHSR